MINENWKDQKRAGGPENPEVDECMLKWFNQAWDKSVCGESGSVDKQAAGV